MKKTGIELPFIECAFLAETQALAPKVPLRVGQVMTSDFVRLPAWLPAAQAARVLGQKTAAYALVIGSRGAALASAQDLGRAPAGKCVSWCATPLGRAVSPELEVAEVRALMDAHSIDGLPVAIDGVIVGIVTRDAIRAAELATTRPASPQLAA